MYHPGPRSKGGRRPTRGNGSPTRQIRAGGWALLQAGMVRRRRYSPVELDVRPVLGSRLAIPERASGSVGLKVAWQRGEKWLRQIAQVAPFPSFNMIRFSHFRFAA
jgi:hypothetical protein